MLVMMAPIGPAGQNAEIVQFKKARFFYDRVEKIVKILFFQINYSVFLTARNIKFITSK